MNYQHLPALNRYTSPAQYEALKEIKTSKSLLALIMRGSMSKTIGSLVRSAWIKSLTYSDDAGVLREGWIVTEAGEHALQLYEKRIEEAEQLDRERRRLAALEDERCEKFYDAALKYYKALIETKDHERIANMHMLGINRQRAEALAKRAQEQALREG